MGEQHYGDTEHCWVIWMIGELSGTLLFSNPGVMILEGMRRYSSNTPRNLLRSLKKKVPGSCSS